MSRNNHFERFESHTQLKHFLLNAYLRQWAHILVQDRGRAHRRPRRIWFIDAFAGCGRDGVGAPGSPVIAADVAREIAAEYFGAPKGTALLPDRGMRVIAVEANAKRARRLKGNMQPYAREEPRVASVYTGVLQEFLGDLQPRVRHDPVLYFFDPFGVDGLDAEVLNQVFDGPRREVLLLFSDTGAVRLAGHAVAQAPNREQLLAERTRTKSLFGQDDDATLEQADLTFVEQRLGGYRGKQQSYDKMTRAFGTAAWVEIFLNTPPALRRERLLDLYGETLRKAGAKYVLRFQVTTSAGEHKYTLLHAATHSAAFAAMKKAMHSARRTIPRLAEQPVLFSLDDTKSAETDSRRHNAPAVETVASEEVRHLHDAVEQIARRFAGQAEVRWIDGRAGRVGVKHYALHDTPLLVHQFDDLKGVLARRGYLKTARPLTYAFPQVAEDGLSKAS
ncbi:MAG: three-Cys-motif partner protein TcmP [Gemmatimonas sp.]|jgi:three-Cys-motif partner protein|uniref:three-Cys-motif partner protein TcmP n=1 Tax=Gemmatimonas sp. TaxID=1962908 RepID=UPI0031C8328E|nr:three-Cys-motif partner protein TcmP [Gemmatimonas sp.]